MDRFGEKLRFLRKREGVSQEQLAEMLEIHRSHIGKLEQQYKIPNAAMILRISRIFNITTDQLMKDELDLD